MTNTIYVMGTTTNGDVLLSAFAPDLNAWVYQSKVVASGNSKQLTVSLSPVLNRFTTLGTARQLDFDVGLNPDTNNDDLRFGITPSVKTCQLDGSACSSDADCFVSSTVNVMNPCVGRPHVAAFECISVDTQGPICSGQWESVNAKPANGSALQFNPEVAWGLGSDGVGRWKLAYKDTEFGTRFVCNGTQSTDTFSPCADDGSGHLACPSNPAAGCVLAPGQIVGTEQVSQAAMKTDPMKAPPFTGPGTLVTGSSQTVCSKLRSGYWGDYDGLTALTPLSGAASSKTEFLTAFTDSSRPKAPELTQPYTVQQTDSCTLRTSYESGSTSVTEATFR